MPNNLINRNKNNQCQKYLLPDVKVFDNSIEKTSEFMPIQSGNLADLIKHPFLKNNFPAFNGNAKMVVR